MYPVLLFTISLFSSPPTFPIFLHPSLPRPTTQPCLFYQVLTIYALLLSALHLPANLLVTPFTFSFIPPLFFQILSTNVLKLYFSSSFFSSSNFVIAFSCPFQAGSAKHSYVLSLFASFVSIREHLVLVSIGSLLLRAM